MNDIELFNEGLKMIEVDTMKAFEYFSKSAELGNAEAMYYLGLIYESGDGAEMNVKKALEMFEKSRAAGCNRRQAISGIYITTDTLTAWSQTATVRFHIF